MKTTFSRNKSGQVSVSFKEMTQGEALSLCHALDVYAPHSVVANDLLLSLRRTIQTNGKTDYDQQLFTALGEAS